METAIDILILETDPGDTLAMIGELRRQGCSISTLATVPLPEARIAISARPPDVTLISLPQPDLRLFELLEDLQESYHSLPVIVVTSRCEPGELVELLESGAAAHLHRQNLGELTAVIRFALENPLPPPAASEIEIVRETFAATESSGAARRTCGTPILRRICERCSRIADNSGEWERFNVFLRRNPKATVALGLCPDCARTRSDARIDPAPAQP